MPVVTGILYDLLPCVAIKGSGRNKQMPQGLKMKVVRRNDDAMKDKCLVHKE